MNKLNHWGPFTVLALVCAAILLLGGVVNVIVDDHYSFRDFIDDLKYLAAALAVGVAWARGQLIAKTREAAVWLGDSRDDQLSTDEVAAIEKRDLHEGGAV